MKPDPTQPGRTMMHKTTLVTLALLALGSGLSAQTTVLEREAAREVLVEIDALQERIAPTERAEALVRRNDPLRDRIMERAEEVWEGGMDDLSDWIGRNPEVGWDEYMAVDTLTAVLRDLDFEVEVGVAGLETAFVASWASPAGPGDLTLGLIGEYDALRGTQGAFHGDQHNAQTPISISAAMAVRDWMTRENVPGRVVIYGTPAEEVGPPAKHIMYEAGVFDDADILVRSHASTGTQRGSAGFGVCCLNINEVKYIFRGAPAHQRVSWHGRNALTAAVQFFTSVDGLRSTFRPEASIQGYIPEGGAAPNVVPDRAVVDYYIRYPDEVYLAHMQRMIDDAARGAAMATGTEVEIDVYGEFRDGISLGTLEELWFAYAREMGAPEIVTEPDRPAGYEETGFLTREIPGVGVSVYSSTAPGHTYEMFEDALKPVGHTGFLMDARIMAAVLYDFATERDFRETVREEHRTLAGLLDRYLANLRVVYGDEVDLTDGMQ